MNNEKGMTLVEVIAVVSILTMIGTVGVNIIYSARGIYDYQVMVSEQTYIVDIMRQAITEEVRYVETLVLDNSLLTEYEGYHSITCTGNQLILTEIVVEDTGGGNLVAKDQHLNSVTTDDGTILEPLNIINLGVVGAHTIKVEYEKVTIESDDDDTDDSDNDDCILKVKVFLDTGTEYEHEFSFSIRLMNMSLYENEITENRGDNEGETFTRILFKDDVD